MGQEIIYLSFLCLPLENVFADLIAAVEGDLPEDFTRAYKLLESLPELSDEDILKVKSQLDGTSTMADVLAAAKVVQEEAAQGELKGRSWFWKGYLLIPCLHVFY